MSSGRARTDGQLPAKLPFGTAPMVGHAYASTAPVLQILLQYWRSPKPVVNFHVGPGGKVGFMPVFTNGTVSLQL